MKNKITIFIRIILVNFFIFSNSICEEIKFEANTIELIDKDQRIIAKKNVKIFNEDETIFANEMDYDKLKEIIKAKGDVRVENINKKIEILSDELDYSKKTEQIIFNKNVEIKFEDNFIFNTNKAVYDKFKDEININNFSSLKDQYGNTITSENFKF